MDIKKPASRLALGAALALTLAAGGAACAAAAPTAPSIDLSTLAADSAFCIDEVNRLRATVGAPALARSSNIEAFSTEAARVDGEAHEGHKHFRQTNGGNGTSSAQNEIPWWKLSQYGSVRAIVRQGLALEWAEGAGGDHYINLTGSYKEIACGISITNGEVTVTQDFR